MENIEEFVKALVKIDFVEQSECYGHYPFQMFAKTEDGQNHILALALGGDVATCYLKFKDYQNKGAKQIYMSVDFPAGGDIKNDFVAVFYFENDELKVFAIPYEPETGKILDRITESTHLTLLINQLKSI